MEHYYDKIVGAFTFPNLYANVVKKFDNAEFVEVGSDEGQSAAFMGVEIINSNKNIKFNCVDIWDKFPTTFSEDKEKYSRFLKNTEPVSSLLKEKFNVICNPSIESSKQFKDESLDFVFIDACHDYEYVMEDLIAWYPKVKFGGIFAGHDYYAGWYGVEQAVNEFFYRKFQVNNSEFCWIVNKI